MKNFIIALLSVACFAACNTDNPKQAETKAPPPPPVEIKADTIEAHAYVCPMDADITSTKAGEKCSKCGMKLVEKK